VLKLEKFSLNDKKLAVEKTSLLFVSDCNYTRTLKEYPGLTRPRNADIAERVLIEHQIQVEGYLCHAHCSLSTDVSGKVAMIGKGNRQTVGRRNNRSK